MDTGPCQLFVKLENQNPTGSIKDRVAQTVMSESALNDAMGAIATFAVVEFVMGTGDGFSLSNTLKDLVWESGMGIFFGAAVGYGAALLMAHNHIGFFRTAMPFVIVLAVILAYLGADIIHASGFMAVFTCGVMLGNKETFGIAFEDHEHVYL